MIMMTTTHKPGDFYPAMRDYGKELVCNKCKNETRSHRDHTGAIWCHKCWLKFNMGPQELAWAIENEAKHAAAEQTRGDRLREQAEVEAARLTPEWKKVRADGQRQVEHHIEEANAELGRMDPHERKVKYAAIRKFAEGLADKTADQVLATMRQTALTAPAAESAAPELPAATGPSPDTTSGGSAAEPPTRSAPDGSAPAAEPSSSEGLLAAKATVLKTLLCEKCNLRFAADEFRELVLNGVYRARARLCLECAREVYHVDAELGQVYYDGHVHTFPKVALLPDAVPLDPNDPGWKNICAKCGKRSAVAEYELEEKDRPRYTLFGVTWEDRKVWLCAECAREVFPTEYDDEAGQAPYGSGREDDEPEELEFERGD